MQRVQTLLLSGRLPEAEATCREIIAYDSTRIDAHFQLGVVLEAQNRHAEAATSFYLATLGSPGYAGAQDRLDVLVERLIPERWHVEKSGLLAAPLRAYIAGRIAAAGGQLRAGGAWEAAAERLESALALAPDLASVQCDLGNALHMLHRMEESAASYRRAIALQPDYADAHYNLAGTLLVLGQAEEAVDCYRQAVSSRPDFAAAHFNLGNTLTSLLRPDEAVRSYRAALALQPDHAAAHKNHSFALLQQGNFVEGWREYEWRVHTDGSRLKSSTKPVWDGSEFQGKTLLVCAEQGLGDTIQFVRLLPKVKALGGTIILECQPLLAKLLQGIEGADLVIARPADGSLPTRNYDLHVHLMSLPCLLGTIIDTIPAEIPYLTADPSKTALWRTRMISTSDGLRVGIVWAGSPDNKNDRSRSMTLTDFLPLRECPGVVLYSLQKGAAAGQITPFPQGYEITDLSRELEDFTDTAAALTALDLLITVDTSVAHLAGALGVPVWTLLPYVPDWRWLLDRDDTPWYPTMRLFRQSHAGDWAGVVTNVIAALDDQVDQKRALSSGA